MPFPQKVIKNRIFITTMLSFGLVASVGYISGAIGLGLFIAAAFFARLLHDMVNYVQHYGLIRVPGSPIRQDHSWDYENPVISSLTLNLNLQAHHHQASRLPYWNLKKAEGKAVLPFGFITCFFIALVPFLWIPIMAKYLKKWDTECASAEERKLIDSNCIIRPTAPMGYLILATIFPTAVTFLLLFTLLAPFTLLIDRLTKGHKTLWLKQKSAKPLLLLLQIWSVAWFKEGMWGASLEAAQDLDSFISQIPSKKRRKQMRQRLKRLNSLLEQTTLKSGYRSPRTFTLDSDYLAIAWRHCQRVSSSKVMAVLMFTYHMAVLVYLPIEIFELRDNTNNLVLMSSSISIGTVIFDLQYAVAEPFQNCELWWLSYLGWMNVGMERQLKTINLLPTMGDTKYLGGCYPLPITAAFDVFHSNKWRAKSPLLDSEVENIRFSQTVEKIPDTISLKIPINI